MDATRVLFLPDIHVPYQDESALAVVKDFRRDFKPHEVVVMGDLLTVDQVSSFPNDCLADLQDEFAQGEQVLDDVGCTVFLEGNHEERLRRAGLVDRRLRSLLSPRVNLHLDQRKIRYVPYDNDPAVGMARFGKLKCIHGFYCGEYPAKMHAIAYGCVVFAHTHRHQTFQPKHALEKNTGFNIGCLCRLDMPWQSTGGPRGWAQGFAAAHIFKSGQFSLEVVRLIGSEFVIQGRHYARR